MTEEKIIKSSIPIIGIDLGTTNSCVAIWEDGKVQILKNEFGSTTTPSIVTFIQNNDSSTDNLRIFVGDPNQYKINPIPQNSISSIKRLMGKNFTNSSHQAQKQQLPYKIINDCGKPIIEISSTMGNNKVTEYFSPEEISKLILQKMKTIAETFTKMEIENAVITVPANFSNAQVASTKYAGQLAGLKVLRILKEPTAAAIAYGLDKKYQGLEIEGANILVFDLGGGTFDISILSLDVNPEPTKDFAATDFTVLRTGGDPQLGGNDFDTRLVNYVLKILKEEDNILINKSRDFAALHEIRKACEKSKRVMSTNKATTIDFQIPTSQQTFSKPITCQQFEDLCSDLFQQMMATLDEVIETLIVQEVIFVGGSTRMPKVKQLITQYFHSRSKDQYDFETVINDLINPGNFTPGIVASINDLINPDETVAFGAAGYSSTFCNLRINSKQQVENSFVEMIVTDILPSSISVLIAEGKTSTILKRDTQIPCKGFKNYTTEVDNQSAREVRIFEGESDLAAGNRLLGHFLYDGIAPAPMGVPKIKISMEIDENGILKVSATEQRSGVSKGIKIMELTGQLSKPDFKNQLSPRKTTTGGNFDIEKFASTFRVAEKLCNNKVLLQEWKTFFQNLLPDETDSFFKFGQQIDKGILSYKELFCNILDIWVSKVEGKKAKIGNLFAILEESSFKLSADMLRANYDSEVFLRT